MKKESIVVFCLSIMIFAIGCVKEKNNQNPTVVFLQPANNLVIDQDTVLTINVEANDADGEVSKLELFIDGALAEVFNSPPYQYAWNISQIENNGLRTIQAIAHDNNGATGQAEISIDINDYRTKYLGDFYFRVITESWMLGQTTTYDTSYYNGLIRAYELTDSENDLFSEDDSAENPDEKITLEFKVVPFFIFTVWLQ